MKNEYEAKEIKGIFDRYDTDKSGVIDTKELGACLKEFGYNLPQ